MELEQTIEYFSILGGVEKYIQIDYFDDVSHMMKTNFIKNFTDFEELVSPSYLTQTPYCELLIAIARGDGKIYSALRKAKLSESAGEKLLEELVSLGILKVEHSRELPLHSHPKHKLPKDQRAYRVQDKLRFRQPFMRFWFGFVSSYAKDLRFGKSEAFLENFTNHNERLRSLIYEQLCSNLLEKYHESKESIVSSGSYWNIYSEFDILAVTQSRKLILGECKYKDRMVCKNELTKLKQKAVESNMNVDTYVLFSKSGFSKELLSMKSKKLLLFELDDLKSLF